MKTIKIVLVTAFLLMTSISSADCIYEGKAYSEGTKIGPYICTNGEWVLG